MPLVRLKISTDIPIHPGFSEAPASFARQHGVELVGDVCPEISYKNDPDNQEKTTKAEANIHLVQHDAIRLFTKRDSDDGVRLRSIDLNPSLLLYGAKNHPLTEGDLREALDILRSAVAPLLAEPSDASHIVPGPGGEEEPRAYWSAISIEVFLPGILLPCLHDLSHPNTGPAEGASKKQIQLGNKSDDNVIRFKKANWQTASPHGVQEVDGVSVRLSLKGHALRAAFGSFGTTAFVKDIRRLVSFPVASVASVHQAELSRLEGTYLPVPPEWRDEDQGKPITHSKTMALVSQLTTIPIEELQEIDEELRHPSASTSKRLKKDLVVEAGRLKPVPVSTLFQPSVYATRLPGTPPLTPGGIDPLVARAYGNQPSDV